MEPLGADWPPKAANGDPKPPKSAPKSTKGRPTTHGSEKAPQIDLKSTAKYRKTYEICRFSLGFSTFSIRRAFHIKSCKLLQKGTLGAPHGEPWAPKWKPRAPKWSPRAPQTGALERKPTQQTPTLEPNTAKRAPRSLPRLENRDPDLQNGSPEWFQAPL